MGATWPLRTKALEARNSCANLTALRTNTLTHARPNAIAIAVVVVLSTTAQLVAVVVALQMPGACANLRQLQKGTGGRRRHSMLRAANVQLKSAKLLQL